MTLLLIGFCLCVLLLAGLGPTVLLVDRGANLPRLVAAPVVGLGCFLYVTHCFAGLGLSGRVSSVSALCVLLGPLVCMLLVPALKNHWLAAAEVRAAAVPFCLALAAVALVCWPLVVIGHDSFLAFGNSDAAFTLAAFEDMVNGAYGQAARGTVRYWPNAQFAHIFGAGYLAVLLSSLTGVPVLNLHETVASALVFTSPLSVYLFSVLFLKSSRQAAVLAALVAAGSSQLSYTFHLQSLGALTLIAVAPALVSLWWVGLSSANWRLVLLAALLFAGTCFGYYAALPILSVLFGATALAHWLTSSRRKRSILLALAFPFAALALAYPQLAAAIVRRTFDEALGERLTVSASGPEVLLSFGFAITENVFPFLLGLTIPSLAWHSPFAPPALPWLGTLVLSFILCGCLVAWLAGFRSRPPLAARLAVLSLLLVLAVYFARNNAYGVFKLAGWSSPFLIPSVAVFLFGQVSDARLDCRVRQACGVVLAALVGMNVVWSLRVGLCSAGKVSPTSKPLAGFSHQDLAKLRDLERIVRPGERVLIMVPDPVLQRWVLTYTRRMTVSVLPFLGLAPDERDAYEAEAAAGAREAVYVLTGSDASGDITVGRRPRPVWFSNKFQVFRFDELRNFIVCGHGWYRLEESPSSFVSLGRRFRWLRSRGEVIIVNPTSDALRVRLTLLSGHGKPDPAREVTILVNDREVDRLSVVGAAVLLSKPFRCSDVFCRVIISLPDDAAPLPRPLALLNTWVPSDGRRLNVAVLRVELLTEDEYERQPLPCAIDLRRQSWQDAQWVTGLYADGWVAKEARFRLRACGRARAITVEGFVPGVSQALFPFPLLMSVNGMPLQRQMLQEPGRFRRQFLLPPELASASHYDVAIRSTKAWFAPGDRRTLSLMLEKVSVVSE